MLGETRVVSILSSPNPDGTYNSSDVLISNAGGTRGIRQTRRPDYTTLESLSDPWCLRIPLAGSPSATHLPCSAPPDGSPLGEREMTAVAVAMNADAVAVRAVAVAIEIAAGGLGGEVSAAVREVHFMALGLFQLSEAFGVPTVSPEDIAAANAGGKKPRPRVGGRPPSDAVRGGGNANAAATTADSWRQKGAEHGGGARQDVNPPVTMVGVWWDGMTLHVPKTKCGNSCYGMCGKGCTCWQFVCGDCGCHSGCATHDGYCSCIGVSHPKCWSFVAFWQGSVDKCAPCSWYDAPPPEPLPQPQPAVA